MVVVDFVVVFKVSSDSMFITNLCTCQLDWPYIIHVVYEVFSSESLNDPKTKQLEENSNIKVALSLQIN